MKDLTFPDKKKIPYYDEAGYSFIKNIKEVASSRGISLIRYLMHKLKLIFLQLLASGCPMNSIRVKLYKMKGVHIGRNVYIGRKVYFDNLYPEFIFLGDNVHLHTECMLISHFNPSVRFSGLLEACANPVIIEDGAIIGLRAIVMPGVKVGRSAMVTAGSVVLRDVQPFTMVQGNPAKKILNFEHML
jgi:acetyltransferase-like isoleucine patch superfamily enzyme